MPGLNRVLVTVGAALAVTGAALAHSPPTEYGVVPQETATATSPPTRSPAPVKRIAQVARPTQPVPPVPPVWLRVASIHSSAAVVPVGVHQDGSLVPPSPDKVGWWIGGSAAGATTGTIVLAGHVDTADGRHGVFYNLSATPPGATVQLSTTNRTFTYKVVALRTYSKQSLPSSLFDRASSPRLLLITCGGPYDHGYTRNVVAFAIP